MLPSSPVPPILYQGLLRSPASWARVGRGYLEGLLEIGHPVEVRESRGFRHDPDFELDPRLAILAPEEARRASGRSLGLGFLHPPHLERLLGQPRVNLFVWESDRVPAEWVEMLEAGTDLVVVPSHFTRDALLRSGMSANQVSVAPYGYSRFDPRPETLPWKVDPRPTLREQGKFRFLAVLAPHHRKGVRELLAAYRQAFTADDAVDLYVKSTYDPGQARRRQLFEIESWPRALEEAGLARPEAPRVTLDLGTLSDTEMERLYRRTSVYLQPSWGESFGLGILEALARGVPALATDWSGHLEFLPPGPDRIPGDLREGGTALYHETPGALVMVPRVEALAGRMRWHFDHPGASREVGLRAREAVRSMTWESASRKLMRVLEKLCEALDVH